MGEQQQPKNIYAAITAIMLDAEPIAKARRNPQQGYSFRGVDDVYAALQVVMARHGVFSVPEVIADRTEERTTAKGTVLIYRVLTIRYRLYAADGSFVDAIVIGEGMDSGDKASNKAMSVAHKYALLQVFCIPTEEPKDPENDDHAVAPRAARPARRPAPSTPTDDAAPASQAERLKRMVDAFAKLGVDVGDVESLVGEITENFNDGDFDCAYRLYERIRGGATVAALKAERQRKDSEGSTPVEAPASSARQRVEDRFKPSPAGSR